MNSKVLKKGKTMREEINSVKGIHFYLKNDVCGRFFKAGEKSDEASDLFSHEDDFSIDVIEQPLHFAVKGKEDGVTLTLHIRDGYGMYLEEYAAISITHYFDGRKPTVKGNGKIGNAADSLNYFFKVAVQLKEYVLNHHLMEDYSGIDPETEGVLGTIKDDEIAFQRVTGKKRPSMVCTSLFGGTGMARPYPDEAAESFMRESLSFEDNLKEAEDGDEDAMGEVALAYLNGDEDEDVEPDPEKAAYWFRKQAELDNPTGCFNLGILYLKGKGVEQSFEQTLFWMQKAEENGDDDAKGIISLSSNILDLQKKAESGDPKAMAELAGQLMAVGNKIGEDEEEEDVFYRKGLEWAKKSERAGAAEAMFVLGLAYDHGRGVEEDKKKAAEYYRRGADMGNADCMNNLGCMYLEGENVPQDKKKGFELCLKAANLGNGYAMRTVGRCYQFENGVGYDMKKAIYWYEKALEIIDDEELAKKVEIFKSLEDIDSEFEEEDEDGKIDEYEEAAEDDSDDVKSLIESISESGEDVNDLIAAGLKKQGLPADNESVANLSVDDAYAALAAASGKDEDEEYESYLYNWTFDEGNRKSVKGWSISIPDGFVVIDSQEDRLFEAVPKGMADEDQLDIPIRILPGNELESKAITGDYWMYHPYARAGVAEIVALQTAKAFVQFTGIAPEILSAGFSDLCAYVIVQDTFGGGYSYQIMILTEGKAQQLRVQTQSITDEQKKELNKSIVSWIETFRFDKPNPSMPKETRVESVKVINDLKRGVTASFDEAVEFAQREYNAAVNGRMGTIQFYAEHDLLEEEAPDIVREILAHGMEVKEFYYLKADQLVEKLKAGKLKAGVMKNIYSKLKDLENAVTECTVGNDTITVDMPKKVTEIQKKWKAEEEALEKSLKKEEREKRQKEEEALRKKEEARKKTQEEKRRKEEEAARKAEEARREKEEYLAGQREAISHVRNLLCVRDDAIAIVTLDGRVKTWGLPGNIKGMVESWKDIKQVDMTIRPDMETVFAVGLKTDGTVLFTGSYDNTRMDLSGWHDIVQISVGYRNVYGLDKEGKVWAAGADYNWQLREISNLSEVFKVIGSVNMAVGLGQEGKICSSGKRPEFTGIVRSPRKNTVDIANYSTLDGVLYALTADGKIVHPWENESIPVTDSWKDIVAITDGSNGVNILCVTANGKVKLDIGYKAKSKEALAEAGFWSNIAYAATGGDTIAAITRDGFIKVASPKDVPAEITGLKLFNNYMTVEEDRVQLIREMEERRLREINERIARLEKELAEAKGIFVGFKKKSLQAEIDELKRQLGSR